jgi:hypothetical protein
MGGLMQNHNSSKCRQNSARPAESNGLVHEADVPRDFGTANPSWKKGLALYALLPRVIGSSAAQYLQTVMVASAGDARLP